MKKPCPHMLAAFHSVTMTMLLLFELHGAKAELISQTADELEGIFRAHLCADDLKALNDAKLSMECLLEKLEACASTTSTATN